MRTLTCLICGAQGNDLVALQEHAVHTHGYEFEDHRHVTRREVTADEYIWTMPDGVDWLHATRRPQ